MSRPTLAVWPFASCGGCQLTLLNCEEELPTLLGAVEIRHFPEVGDDVGPGPYDISIIEGSVTTPQDLERIIRVREVSRHVVTVGACATSGGIQALRNLMDVAEVASAVYPAPAQLALLDRSTPAATHITVDAELPGCPVDGHQLLEVLAALLQDRRPRLPDHSVCLECRSRDTVCVLVARGLPCLGPVTRTGCGALCPTWGRGCFGCFGPHEAANPASLADGLAERGASRRDLRRLFRGVAGGAEPFRRESARQEGDE